MNEKAVKNLRRKIAQLKAKGGIKSREVVSLAEALGRKRKDRGKEPTFVNETFKELHPVSIPNHTELNRNTARRILTELEADVEKWENYFEMDHEYEK